MRVLKRKEAMNNSDTIDAFATNDSWRNGPEALDSKPIYDQSFVLSTEKCAYIHGALLASIFILGITR